MAVSERNRMRDTETDMVGDSNRGIFGDMERDRERQKETVKESNRERVRKTSKVYERQERYS